MIEICKRPSETAALKFLFDGVNASTKGTTISIEVYLLRN